MNKKGEYDAGFFADQQDGSYRSAKTILPIIFNLISPKAVIDVGCGVGPWLAASKELGAVDILGIDGYGDNGILMVPSHCFRRADLTKPLEVGRRFDLAICVEVAEHLPDSAAPVLIQSLTSLAPVVLFSAAIPEQGGEAHINEQWPLYWETLFRTWGYTQLDCIRWRVWESPGVDAWYAQNCFLFVSDSYLVEKPQLQAEKQRHNGYPVRVVHPSVFRGARKYENLSLRSLFRMMGYIPGAAAKAIEYKVRTLRTMVVSTTKPPRESNSVRSAKNIGR
jgi:SAM-dependent methyltransferase